MDVSHLLLLLLLLSCCLAETRRTAHGSADELSRRLAQGLGLSKDEAPPGFMLELYKAATGKRELFWEQSYPNANMVGCMLETGPRADGLLRFNVSLSSPSEELIEAELHVFAPAASASRVRVRQLTGSRADLLLNTSPVSAAGDWVVVRLGPKTAGQVGRAPLTLRLTEVTSDGQERPLKVVRRAPQQHHLQPLLVLYSRSQKNNASHEQPIRQAGSVSHNRSRRSLLDRVATCERREHIVTTEEKGWDKWILSPKKFDLGQCEGSCHLSVCVPTRFKNVHVFHFVNTGTAFSKDAFVKVVECGCPRVG